MVAGPVEEGGGLLAADAPGLGNQVNGLFNDLVHKPGVEFAVRGLLVRILLLHLRLQAVDGLVLVRVRKEELLRLGGLAGGLVDDPQLQHPVQNGLLALLVEVPGGLDGAVILLELGLAEGIVEGGVVGDADDGGALRQIQLRYVLAEVALGGGLNAVVAASKEDPVEIHGDDILLAGGLLKLQSPEDLPELPLDGHLRVLGDVAQQLLGDGGAAPGAAAGEGGLDGAGGAPPVHALVLPEAVVLNGHQGLDEVVREVLVLDELPVAAAGFLRVVKEGLEDHLVAIFVRGVDGGGQGHGHLLVGDLPQGGDEGGINVGHEDLGEDGRRQHADDAKGEQDQEDPADQASDGELLLFLLAGSARSAALGAFGRTAICTIHGWTYLLLASNGACLRGPCRRGGGAGESFTGKYIHRAIL